MSRYVDVEKIPLINTQGVSENGDVFVSLLDVWKAIRQTPTADVVEVRHATWVEDEQTYCGAGRCNYTCTVCGGMISAIRKETTEHLYPYCPFCGAKMDGERKENER